MHNVCKSIKLYIHKGQLIADLLVHFYTNLCEKFGGDLCAARLLALAFGRLLEAVVCLCKECLKSLQELEL